MTVKELIEELQKCNPEMAIEFEAEFLAECMECMGLPHPQVATLKFDTIVICPKPTLCLYDARIQ